MSTRTKTRPPPSSDAARIIAEDDTHAVVQVRIHKSWIGRRLPFLAALSALGIELPPRVSE